MLFFLFVGLLSFGLSWVGIAAGVFTIVNVLFNIYVLKFNVASRVCPDPLPLPPAASVVAAHSLSAS